ncbi:hypothetical protein BGZ61DRAFT_445989 [Ilyonectria robusta]|uniref:uncharacterized protein n=1 Tax=Ilyonectria robusta TaxID=1079257 RepID=UPI001E8EAE06|nr:uncharacterized protein BGZ61DRAFT_445989 [Ilyonectria robusta]KAH8729216.1 hypothetical protein BGZ61DRAFT_445989 [Ilyonectria robusta]
MGSDTEYHRRRYHVPHQDHYRTQRSIVFYHPAYSWPQNILFKLPQVDLLDARGQPTSLHHRTALLACQVIANNSFLTGRLYFDALGRFPVLDQVPLDAGLTRTEYYYIVNGNRKYPAQHPNRTRVCLTLRLARYRYPVVPSFQDWRFPHESVPHCWPEPDCDRDAKPKRCAVTGHSFAVLDVLAIPKADKEWFDINGMRYYDENPFGHGYSRNRMHVRADLLQAFNDDLFIIVPKPRRVESPEYVVHAITANDPEFCSLYHNRPVVNVDNVSRQFLLARFARTVLPLANAFIVAGTHRNVVLVDRDANGRISWAAEEISGKTLAKHYGYPDPRSLRLSPGPVTLNRGSTRSDPGVASVNHRNVRSLPGVVNANHRNVRALPGVANVNHRNVRPLPGVASNHRGVRPAPRVTTANYQNARRASAVTTANHRDARRASVVTTANHQDARPSPTVTIVNHRDHRDVMSVSRVTTANHRDVMPATEAATVNHRDVRIRPPPRVVRVSHLAGNARVSLDPWAIDLDPRSVRLNPPTGQIGQPALDFRAWSARNAAAAADEEEEEESRGRKRVRTDTYHPRG